MTDRKPIATYCLSNCGGVEILDVTDETVDWRYYDDEEGTSEIEYDTSEEARAFFMIGEMKIYLDECMKVR